MYDHNEPKVKELTDLGATGSTSLADFCAEAHQAARLDHGSCAVTGQTVMQLADEFEADDIIIDGGNSYYRDDIARASALASKKIHYVDVGTSGGVFDRSASPHDRRRRERRAAPRFDLRHHRFRRRRRC